MDKKIALYTDGGALFQTLSTTTSSQQSSAIDGNRILITTNAAHYIAFGTNPTANSSGFLLPAGVALQFNFTSGEKVAAATLTGSGILSIVNLD